MKRDVRKLLNKWAIEHNFKSWNSYFKSKFVKKEDFTYKKVFENFAKFAVEELQEKTKVKD